ncbi:MAG: hypothetical protein ACLRSW_05510 [Christensenellaceae bacterium]
MNAELPNRSFWLLEHALTRASISCEGGAAAKICPPISTKGIFLLMHSYNFCEINIVTEGTGTHHQSNSFAQTGTFSSSPEHLARIQ